jgi:CheY-like chemotaxis protein
MTEIEGLSYLVVDDDPITRNIMTVLLGTVLRSSQLTLFENSKDFEVRVMALPYSPDIVFLDIAVLPYDGYEMLKIIKPLEKYRDSKIVAITARVMQEEIQRMKVAGFDGMISKPIIRQVFPQLVKRIIAGEEIWYIA